MKVNVEKMRRYQGVRTVRAWREACEHSAQVADEFDRANPEIVAAFKSLRQPQKTSGVSA